MLRFKIYTQALIITLILNDLGQTISKGGRKQFTGTAELKKTQSSPQLLLKFIGCRRLLLQFQLLPYKSINNPH